MTDHLSVSVTPVPWVKKLLIGLTSLLALMLTAIGLLSYLVVTSSHQQAAQTSSNRRQIVATKTIIQQQASDTRAATLRQEQDATRQAALAADAVRRILAATTSRADRSDAALRLELRQALAQILAELQAIRSEQQRQANSPAADQPPRPAMPHPTQRPTPRPRPTCAVVSVLGRCIPR